MRMVNLLMYGVALVVVLGSVDLFLLDGRYGAPIWHLLGQQADWARAAFQRMLNRFA